MEGWTKTSRKIDKTREDFYTFVMIELGNRLPRTIGPFV